MNLKSIELIINFLLNTPIEFKSSIQANKDYQEAVQRLNNNLQNLRTFIGKLHQEQTLY